MADNNVFILFEEIKTALRHKRKVGRAAQRGNSTIENRE